MITLRDLFPPAAEEGWTDAQVAQMQKRLADAYRATFSGSGTQEDASLVLVDLARFTRYLDTTSIDAPADVAKALDQRRAVFVRIAEAVIMSGGNLDGLHRAVLMAPPIDVEET